jgi:hypothetical protein
LKYLISATLLVAGFIHLLPLIGVVGVERLSALYGIPVSDPNLQILMRHRAVLFGLLGAFLCFAAFTPALQWLGFIAGFVSVISFLWLAWSVGGYNPLLARVVTADWIALASLIIGALARGALDLQP